MKHKFEMKFYVAGDMPDGEKIERLLLEALAMPAHKALVEVGCELAGAELDRVKA